ncbi:MAG: hypothetical protein ACI4M3_02150 [Acutalibacteraceae bacterium]
MITVLSVTDKPPQNIHEKIRAVFKPCTVSATQISEKNFSLLHIRYQRHRGGIRFKKIYPLALGSPKEIICSAELDLSGTPFVRFENHELTERLFFNFIRSMFKNLNFKPENLSLTLYDLEGKFSYLAEFLLQYAVDVTVITNATEFYEKEAQRYMDNFGASLRIQSQINGFVPFLISPSRIGQTLPLEQNTLVFTPYKPSVGLNGLVFDKMTVQPPPIFQRLKPDEVDSLTFLSALYSLEFCRELGKLKPNGFEICGQPYTLAQCITFCQKHIR